MRDLRIPGSHHEQATFFDSFDESTIDDQSKGNWTLLVRIDGDEILLKSIDDSCWQEFPFDLTKHARETVKIELENRASDWVFEAAYWSLIEVVEQDVELRNVA